MRTTTATDRSGVASAWRTVVSSLGLTAMFASVMSLGACCPVASPERMLPIRVAAASDLAPAVEELARAFTAQTERKVIFTFGSSGLLAQQVAAGAPFDLFLSANTSFVDDVVNKGVCDAASVERFARGRLALVLRADADPTSLALSSLTGPGVSRVAIAQPDHAPYGTAAKEALVDAGMWELVEPKLVYAENVRQTLQFVTSGNVDAALVAASLVIGDREHAWALVDRSAHRPIEQTLVVCTRGLATPGARRFARFLLSEDGRATLGAYGFEIQDAESP